MGVVRRVLGAVAVAVLLVAVLGISACSQAASSRPPSQQAVFDGVVVKADAASASGDAETAFTLYSEALQTGDATDTTGLVAGKQEKAKRLMLSRRILAKSEPTVDSLSSYVQVLQYADAESTEAVAARNGLVDCLKPYPGQLRADVAEMRRGIKGNKSVEMSLTVSLVLKMAEGWRAELAQAPGSVGTHAAAAAKYMDTAAQAVDTAFGRKYAKDALRDLAAADKAIAAADREFAAARS
jgi:hypothetical protein